MKLALPTAFAFALFALATHADSGGQEYRYEIHEAGVNQVLFAVRYEFDTKDGCNSFGLSGSLKDRGREENARVMEADVTVTQTMMACPDLEEPQHLTLESDVFEITGGENRVDAVIYVPEGMTIHCL